MSSQEISQLFDVFDKRLSCILDLGFPMQRMDALRDFVGIVWQANADLNLFSRKMTPEELIDNHLLDCLLPLSSFPQDVQNIADFGSGGGFPGVIFSIAFPEKQFFLYEKSPKKQQFLKKCQQKFGNIQVQGEITAKLPNIDLVTSRAFKPLDVILDLSRDYYRSGGQYFLLKGRNEKIQEELTLALKKFKDLKTEIHPLKSPVLDVERHLVLARRS